MLGFLQWLADKLFAPFGRRRAFDAEVLDATLRQYQATTAGFVARLDGRRPTTNPWTAAGTPYTDAASIGDDEAVARLAHVFRELERIDRAGLLGGGSAEDRATVRGELIEAMEGVRAAAIRRRRRM